MELFPQSGWGKGWYPIRISLTWPMNIFLVCMCWWLVASSIKTYCQETPHNNITSHQTVPRVETQCWATECSPPAICSSAIADQKFVMKLICMNLKLYKYSETLMVLGKLRKRAEKSDVCRLKCGMLLTGGANTFCVHYLSVCIVYSLSKMADRSRYQEPFKHTQLGEWNMGGIFS